VEYIKILKSLAKPVFHNSLLLLLSLSLNFTTISKLRGTFSYDINRLKSKLV
jgi:hypothetical protein